MTFYGNFNPQTILVRRGLKKVDRFPSCEAPFWNSSLVGVNRKWTKGMLMGNNFRSCIEISQGLGSWIFACLVLNLFYYVVLLFIAPGTELCYTFTHVALVTMMSSFAPEVMAFVTKKDSGVKTVVKVQQRPQWPKRDVWSLVVFRKAGDFSKTICLVTWRMGVWENMRTGFCLDEQIQPINPLRTMIINNFSDVSRRSWC